MSNNNPVGIAIIVVVVGILVVSLYLPFQPVTTVSISYNGSWNYITQNRAWNISLVNESISYVRYQNLSKNPPSYDYGNTNLRLQIRNATTGSLLFNKTYGISNQTINRIETYQLKEKGTVLIINITNCIHTDHDGSPEYCNSNEMINLG